MKRVISFIMVIAALMSVVPANAAEISNSPKPLYIASVNCPQEYIDYVEENAHKLILSVSDADSHDFSIGTPFAFAEKGSDVFYFPVMDFTDLKYLLRVYPDGHGYSAVISEFLVDAIDELSDLTSESNPMYLRFVGTKIVATIGHETFELFEYPENIGIADSVSQLLAKSNYAVHNVKEPIDVNLTLAQERANNVYIPLRITETQSGNNWCTAFCLATIIRTLKPQYYDVTAKALVSMVYDKSDPDVEKIFPWDSILPIASKYVLFPYVLEHTTSAETLYNELDAQRPCILWMKSSKYDHAVVLNGYRNQDTWSIWNPWYTTCESFLQNGTYLPMSKTTLDWILLIYGVSYKFNEVFYMPS